MRLGPWWVLGKTGRNLSLFQDVWGRSNTQTQSSKKPLQPYRRFDVSILSTLHCRISFLLSGTLHKSPEVDKWRCTQSPLKCRVSYFSITEFKKTPWKDVTGNEMYLGSWFQRNRQSWWERHGRASSLVAGTAEKGSAVELGCITSRPSYSGIASGSEALFPRRSNLHKQCHHLGTNPELSHAAVFASPLDQGGAKTVWKAWQIREK